MNYFFKIFSALIIFLGTAKAQDTLLFKEYEDSLKSGFDKLFSYNGTKYFLEDSLKNKLNNDIVTYFKEALNQKNSFLYPFSSLKKVGKLVSEDKKLRIFTWNIKYNDGTYKYFGFIQHYNKKTDKYDLYELNDDSENMANPEDLLLDNKHWFGCLYYQIVEKKLNGKIIYNLIGWDGNNYLSHKKIIDVLYFTKDGLAKFGAKIFKTGKNLQKRVIFEYSAQVVMFLKYEERYKKIVFDHLIPNPKSMEGKYAFYYPDGTYDAFDYIGDSWVFISDFYATNPVNKEKEKLLKELPEVKKSDEFYNYEQKTPKTQ
jgi:hypothetical protein